MSNPHAIVCALSLLAGLAFPIGVAADPWTAELQGGGQVQVDPRTNRPTLRIEGERVQLPDGIHRLQDGRELTVRSGRVVPNEEILGERDRGEFSRPPPAPTAVGRALILGSSPCEELVRKVCGPDEACAGTTACDAARQLMNMERDEQQRAGTPGRATLTSGKCTEAKADDFFPRCPDNASSGE